MDLIGQGIGTNPRRKTSFTGSNGLTTTGTMNPLGLTQNDPSVGYMGESAAPAPTVQPTAPAAAPVPQSVTTPLPADGGMTYTKPPSDLISTGMPGQSLQPTGGATDQAADPYSVGVQGSSIGRQIQGQQPQQMDAPLQALAPQYGPNGAPSWGGPRFMNGGQRRRQPFQPTQAPALT